MAEVRNSMNDPRIIAGLEKAKALANDNAGIGGGDPLWYKSKEQQAADDIERSKLNTFLSSFYCRSCGGRLIRTHGVYPGGCPWHCVECPSCGSFNKTGVSTVPIRA